MAKVSGFSIVTHLRKPPARDRDQRCPSAPIIIVRVSPNVRRDLALLGKFDHVNRRLVSARSA
jgi:hypothetical protein